MGLDRDFRPIEVSGFRNSGPGTGTALGLFSFFPLRVVSLPLFFPSFLLLFLFFSLFAAVGWVCLCLFVLLPCVFVAVGQTLSRFVISDFFFPGGTVTLLGCCLLSLPHTGFSAPHDSLVSQPSLPGSPP